MDKENLIKIFNSNSNTLMETLDIQFVDFGDDFVTAKMPVTPKVFQPDGILHGGATVALAETVGSSAAFILNKDSKQTVRGIEISANHLKSISSGYVYATAKPLNKGKAEIEIAPIIVHTAVTGIYLYKPPNSEALQVPAL